MFLGHLNNGGITFVICSLLSLVDKSFSGRHSVQARNPLYTGGLFHSYLLDESICHFRGVRSILSVLLYF